ncbi:MAG: sulfur-carrier protein [Clostridiales bacterium]|jgi:molybdopterin converting factor small subunit|nr:sulfur-carrier protein [Clostridiales bacterium]
MKITVKLFATLRNYYEKEFSLEVPDDATPGTVVKQLNLPDKDIAIIMINGRGQKLDAPLSESDVLALFPPVGGG